MDQTLTTIIGFVQYNSPILLPIAIAAVVCTLLVREITVSRAEAPSICDTERRFRTVFAIMTEDRRQSLVEHYARKHACNRLEAMQWAIEDRARDEIQVVDLRMS